MGVVLILVKESDTANQSLLPTDGEHEQVIQKKAFQEWGKIKK